MTVPQTQRALLITSLGQPLELVTDHPVPQPGPNQLQVRVTIAGVNPHDQLCRDIGLFVGEFLPVSITNDIVGVVTALGSDMTAFAIGDKVFGQANFEPGSPQNGTQEYAVLDADFVAKVPPGISDDEAATLPTNAATSVISLFDPANLGIPAPWSADASSFDYQDAAILIVGGGTTCGKFGVQLAALAGIGTIIVVGGPEPELKSYGATHVLDRHLPADALLARIRDITGDDLVYAYDTANPPETQVLAANALSATRRGRLARLLPIGPLDESQVQPKEKGFDLIDIHGSCHAHPRLSKEFWERIPALLTQGKIKPGRFVVEDTPGLDAGRLNALLDRYRSYEPVVKTHFHL